MPGGVLVFAEQREGAIKRASLEAISEGRRVADGLERTLVAAVAGAEIASAGDEAARHGADRVLLLESPVLGAYSTEGFAAAIGQAIEEVRPEILLLAST